MKNFMLALACMCLLAMGAVGAEPQGREYDPLERSLIFVEAGAEAYVPVNCFELVFEFDSNRDSFTDAAAESERVINEIDKKVKELKIPNAELIKGWGFIKQSKISIGDKGRKLSNVVTIRVKDFQQGKLHELIARIVDAALGVDKDIAFKEVRSLLSDSLEKAKKDEVMAQALEKLKANAEKAAGSLGKKVAAPKRVYTVENEAARADQETFRGGGAMPMQMSRAFVSVQKGFEVDAQVQDRVRVAASVAGVYQIE